jgi:hypothetical protein
LGVSGNIEFHGTNAASVVLTAMLGGELQNLCDIGSTER